MMEPLLDSQQGTDPHPNHMIGKITKGGLITMPFIIANEALEKVAGYGLGPNMILYLINDYHLSLAKGSIILSLWSAATNFMPLVGAFVSDAYLGRFLTIGFSSIASFLGMVILWLTAMFPQLKPPHCDQSTQSCKSANAAQITFLVFSFILTSIGAGGVRPCSLAFGADQLDKRDNPNNEKILERFFGWYYASASLSALAALTVIVYIQDHLGWKVGFGVPTALMLCSLVLFFVASPFYIKHKASQSLFTGFAQVTVVAFKNRKLSLPSMNSNDVIYHCKKDSELVAPTDKLRFLNKACIIRNPEQDITPDGSASNAWNLCTVDQVETLKAIIRVIPLWTSGVIMSVNINQTSFPLLQAKSMDRHITAGFQIPPASFSMFLVIATVLWVVVYDRIFIPLASKIRGKPVRLNPKLRMGIGIFFSFTAMEVSAMVENVRRTKAIRAGFLDNPKAVLDMSAMWLVPQNILSGFAEAANAIGQTEFYYSEFPKSMSSIGSSLFFAGMGTASLVASVILSSVDKITSKGGKDSWISDDINRGRYDNYYWLLAGISSLNMIYFLFCSWAYGPCAEDNKGCVEKEEALNRGRVVDEGNRLLSIHPRVGIVNH